MAPTKEGTAPLQGDTDGIRFGILTISDTRTLETDTSGSLLAERVSSAGHLEVAREMVRDNIYAIRAVVSSWIADPGVDVILTTGGTGLTGRDGTPEAVLPLLDRTIDGFGEAFRSVSWRQVGSSSMTSRAFGGVANGTLVFCVPGSNNACATAWDELLATQLDASATPCNLVALLPRLAER